MAHEMQNFQEDVLDASHESPVVVDFWAPWCGPCRILGPVLEQLASENGHAWKLVKVNTDEQQELSMRYGIRGIPAVKMFIDGEVVDEFTGALPKRAVEQWLARAIPSRVQQLVEQARALLAEGQREAARKSLVEALSDEPGNADASVTMAQLVLFEDPAESQRLVEGAEILDPVLRQVADGVLTIARVLTTVPPYDNLPQGDGKNSYVAAIEALRARDLEGAIESFIDVIRTDRYYDDDGARKACLALFSTLGEDSEITREYRPRFNMALY